MLVQDFISDIHSVTAEFKDTFGHLTPAQMNYKPNSSVWSVAQNIEHLIKVNDSYLPTFDAIEAGTNKLTFFGKFKWWQKMCGNMILKSVEPTREKKIGTFPIWQPAMSDSSENILDEFEAHQQGLCAVIDRNKVHIENGVAIASPANANIAYTAAKALDIIVTHERRHLQQAKEMLSLIDAYEQSKA